MGEQKKRSKKRSNSKNQNKLLRGFTLYLCNCVDYDQVADALHRAGIRYQRHRDHFKGSTPDTELLKKVGRKRWILITADKRQRIRPLERQLIIQFKVREFVLTGPELGDLGELLIKARKRMRNLCSKNQGPFIAALSKGGNIRLKALEGADLDNSVIP